VQSASGDARILDMKTKNGRLIPWGVLALSFIAFISLGMPDGLLGVAWPSMSSFFGQDLESLGFLLASVTLGYLLSSFSSGWLVQHLGVGRLLGLSCLFTGLALVLYTFCPWWALVLVFACFLGLGAGAIDAGLNNYVEAHFSEGLMQWLHAFYGLGITAGPLIMTWGIQHLNSWKPGYLIVGIFQLLLALTFLIKQKAWEDKPGDLAGKNTSTEEAFEPAAFVKTLQNPRAWLSASLFLIYAGIELGTGHWAFSILTKSRGISDADAGLASSLYWFLFTVGRILAGLASHKVKARTLVWAGMGLGLVSLSLYWLNVSPLVSLLALGLSGFALAPIFPGLVSTTAGRVGKAHTGTVIGMQMSFAGLGVGLLPGLEGALASVTSLEFIPLSIVGLMALLMLLHGLSLVQKKKV